jgi:hypothetical protein
MYYNSGDQKTKMGFTGLKIKMLTVCIPSGDSRE